MKDIYNLERFASAQDKQYKNVVDELKRGKKISHWMWYIFPQVEGLGNSEISRKFSIKSRDEAIEYLNHSILGARLKECTRLILDHKTSTAEKIFGYPDYLKFYSSMTLFDEVSDDECVFHQALVQFNYEDRDSKTLELLQRL